ncbi:uncharacterized protein F5891DRAFT_1189442 [Suillus fuscotomentosus]|uniref:Fungal-type protein kinase domain-containing protein n=1 Tax=Suillus fuscotomentosus TaxID=1912939 RepID=A0AAD4E4L7_9AGAM|nr:uncharacterized protein F5891DRAFT_1189442 [Suillus fuscotomentosus]KAG1899633.1 hypothetical protein F5891DRAFT_1189442 [Suillus fuscotomentosus]
MAFFFRTIDNGIKLLSLVSIPEVTDVHTMNKITSDELNRLVTHEGSPEASQLLGHLLSEIFQPFTEPLPNVCDLKIPFGKIIHRNNHINEKFSETSPDTLVPLYDTEAKTWNWALPVDPPGDDDSSLLGQVELSESNNPQEATHKEIFAAFLNALVGCFAASQPKLVAMRFATSSWSAANAHKALPGSDIKCKPDIVLSDNISAKWGNIRVSAELTHSRYQPAMRLGKAADTHAYLMMSEQPWRRFALILSFTDEYRHLRVLMYDHSGGAVSPRFNIYTQPDIFSHIIAAITFGSLECVGYDPTVSFSRTVAVSQSKDICVYRPIKNASARCTTTDNAVAASTSDSLSFSEDPDGVSSNALESSISDNSDESSNDSTHDSMQGNPSGSPTHDSMDEGYFPAPPPPVHPTATHSGPLVSLASQVPQAEMTESIYSVTPLPSQFPYSTQSPEPCGKIHIGQTIYTIKRILFTSQGLVGRGTICYLVTLDDEDCIIKDHWVVDKDDRVVLNEIKMLELMDGVPGIPKLVDYWIVERSDGMPDVTKKYRKKECRSTQGTSRTHVRPVLKPCGRPLHMFRTLKEFVRALRDIVKIQQTAVEEHQILHQDCSLNNAMILDDISGREGFLIDWEFAVCIAADHKYPLGGTGTVPFMSRGLLNQVSVIQQEAELESQEKKATRGRKSVEKLKTPKSSSDSKALPVSYVLQTFSDDLESLFFVFAWACIKFCGPNSMVHKECSPNSLLNQWTNLDLGSCATFKITFFANPTDGKHLIDEFHPYFNPLIPLTIEWCRVLVDNMIHPVTFDTILGVLNSHLDKLPDDEELVSTVNMFMNDAVILTCRVKGKQIASESFSVAATTPKQQKSRHGDTESDSSASGSDT